MGRIRNVELSEEYETHRKERILRMRDEAYPPVPWIIIARQFNICFDTVKKIYKEAKRESKE